MGRDKEEERYKGKGNTVGLLQYCIKTESLFLKIPHIYGHLIFGKYLKTIQWKNE